MYYVYVLQSIKYSEKIYIGYTGNLNNRIKQHNQGLSNYTSRFLPWKIIYYEAFLTEKLARTREFRLKTNGNAMIELKKRINLYK